jgi:parallel beta-helix repeat protein
MIAGDATGLGGAFYDAGGGIYILTATVTLSDSRIVSSTASYGGGLFASEGVVALKGSSVTSNNVALNGGGLYLEYSSVSLDNSSIISNTASNNGGGVYLSWSTGELTANTIASNTANRNGGGLYLNSSPVTVANNTVGFNVACCTHDTYQGGGGIYLNGSGATLSTNIVVSNTAFIYGGGLRLQNSTAIIRHNTILSNSAALGGGGGLILSQGNPEVDGNTIVANSGRDGGGIYFAFNDSSLTNNIVAENRATRYGSGIYVVVASPKFLHTTIARNAGGDGAGIHVTYATADFTNTILVSHTQGITVGIESTATLQATVWGNGVWANSLDWGGSGAVITGPVNLNGDPMFVDPATQDYHISSESAARDTGMNAGVNTDLDGNPRPFGPGYDIGADEFIMSLNYHLYLPVILNHAL